MAAWTCVLTLNADRSVVAGSEAALAGAVRGGADLRICTEFLYNEHVDTSSDNPEMVREVCEFKISYLLDDAWVAAAMGLRQPTHLPDGFGARPSMSFFLYNQNGQQAIARPYLDGPPARGTKGPVPPRAHPDMPKMLEQGGWDSGTNAPSRNFIYDFEVYRFYVNDSWEEVFAHDADGGATSGSVDDLAEAFSEGKEVKVGVRDLCQDVGNAETVGHELFTQVGSCYYFTESRRFVAGSHPVVRVKPVIPLLYESDGWDFGWLMLRSDGHVVYRRCDPYTLRFEDLQRKLAVRWFVR